MEDTESNEVKPSNPAKGHHFWLKLLIVLVGCLVYTLILEKSGMPMKAGGFDEATGKWLNVWQGENLLPLNALMTLLDQTESAMETLGDQFYDGALSGEAEGEVIGRTLLSALKGCLVISALKIGMLIYVNPGAISFDRIAGITSGIDIHWDAKPTLGEILFGVAKIIGTVCVVFAYLVWELLLGMLKFLLALIANPVSVLIVVGLVGAVAFWGGILIGFFLPLFIVLIVPDLLYCGFRHYFCTPSEPREINVGVMLLSDAIAIVAAFFCIYWFVQLVTRLFGEAAMEAALGTPYMHSQIPGFAPTLAQALQAGGVRAHLMNIFAYTYPIPALYIHTAFKNKFLFNE